jgi:hypothetical protein
MDERDAIREVLFMIQGYPGVLFQMVEPDNSPIGDDTPIWKTKDSLTFKVVLQSNCVIVIGKI